MPEGIALQKIRINDTELHYLESGSGTPLVFVHGTLGDYRAWENQFGLFASQFHVISYSRRYHYPNQWNGDGLDYSAPLHARDLEALLTAKFREPAHIVASSYGANVALALATRSPQLIRTLVLGEPPAISLLFDHPEGAVILDKFITRSWNPAGEALRDGNARRGVELFIDGVIGEGSFGRFPEQSQLGMIENARELLAEINSPDVVLQFRCEDARAITLPVLLLSGELSPAMFRLINERLRSCLPQVRTETIPAASHGMHSHNPPVYNDTVLRFLVGE